MNEQITITKEDRTFLTPFENYKLACKKYDSEFDFEGSFKYVNDR